MAPPQNTQTQTDELLRRIDELERHLDQTRAELEAADRLSTLGLLTGAIAHECNNVLTPVLSYARAALDAPGDSVLQRKALQRAAEGAERVARIAASVLRLAGGAASPGPEPASCDPTEAISRAVGCLSRPPQECGIDLQVDSAPGLRLAIPPTDLEHVLLNLLLNSVRAMRGGGVITIRCSVAPTGSTWNIAPGMALLEVVDTGPGIDAAVLETLFHPSRRGQRRADATEAIPSNGLGLIICRRLVEASGGTIEAESQPGHGARFGITLPVLNRPAIAA